LGSGTLELEKVDVVEVEDVENLGFGSFESKDSAW
jgi:hypothetical protein